MPNYVYSRVSFMDMNEAATEKLKSMYANLTDGEPAFGRLFIGIDETATEENLIKLSWNHENIGPKWTFIEDYDEHSISMNSAWSAPEDGLVKLLEVLSEYDPNIVTFFSYEDEAYNFAGAYLYDGAEIYDGYEDDYDDIVWTIENKFPELADMKEEDGELTEDGWELLNENMYELVEDARFEFEENAYRALMESRKSGNSNEES